MISVSELSARFGLLRRVALAEQQVAAFAEAHRDRRNADREDEGADDRRAAGEAKRLHDMRPWAHTSCAAEGFAELSGALRSRLSQQAAYRSPGCLVGFTDTGTSRSSAVRMIRFCSTVCAAG